MKHTNLISALRKEADEFAARKTPSKSMVEAAYLQGLIDAYKAIIEVLEEMDRAL